MRETIKQVKKIIHSLKYEVREDERIIQLDKNYLMSLLNSIVDNYEQVEQRISKNIIYNKECYDRYPQRFRVTAELFLKCMKNTDPILMGYNDYFESCIRKELEECILDTLLKNEKELLNE